MHSPEWWRALMSAWGEESRAGQLADATEARVEARTHGSVMFNRTFPCEHARWDEDEAGRMCMDCARPLPREDQ